MPACGIQGRSLKCGRTRPNRRNAAPSAEGIQMVALRFVGTLFPPDLFGGEGGIRIHEHSFRPVIAVKGRWPGSSMH